MESAGNNPPPKPWERAGSSSGPAPFKPPSPGSTSDVVEASGTAKPGEVVASGSAPVNRTALSRPVPARPWEQNYGSSIGGYGSTMNNNSGYGSGMYGNSYGSSYGGIGGTYGGGMYGSSMYNRGGLGGMYGGSGMYGGGMYSGGLGGGLGGPMGGYGMGMGGPYGDQDPNNPYGGFPQQPPGFWVSFIRVMQGVVTFFGRISFLVDQNTQAFHMFMNALLQLLERSGFLYGELARFVLRLLGIRTKPKKVNPAGPEEADGQRYIQGPDGQRYIQGPDGQRYIQGPDGQRYIEGPKAVQSGNWDSVWGNEAVRGN